LREQVFHVAKTETEPVIEPDRVADDLDWESIATIARDGISHAATVPALSST
jgi:hypothetical protein